MRYVHKNGNCAKLELSQVTVTLPINDCALQLYSVCIVCLCSLTYLSYVPAFCFFSFLSSKWQVRSGQQLNKAHVKMLWKGGFFLRKFKIVEMVWNVGRLRFLVSSNRCLHPVSEVKLSICKSYTDVVVLSEILWVQCRWLRAVAVSLKCENAKPLKRAPCFCPPPPTWILMEILHVAPEKRARAYWKQENSCVHSEPVSVSWLTTFFLHAVPETL